MPTFWYEEGSNESNDMKTNNLGDASFSPDLRGWGEVFQSFRPQLTNNYLTATRIAATLASSKGHPKLRNCCLTCAARS